MLKHTYVPREFGRGIVIASVKDKHGNLSSSDNYKGINVSVPKCLSNVCCINLIIVFCLAMTCRFKKNLGCGPGVFYCRVLLIIYHLERVLFILPTPARLSITLFFPKASPPWCPSVLLVSFIAGIVSICHVYV